MEVRRRRRRRRRRRQTDTPSPRQRQGVRQSVRARRCKRIRLCYVRRRLSCGAHSLTRSCSSKMRRQPDLRREGRGGEGKTAAARETDHAEQRRRIMDPSWNNHRRAAHGVGRARRHARRLTSRQGKEGELGADLHRGRHGLQDSPQSPANQH